MAVRRNGLYFDPTIASAFDNLAEAFKTPTGADVYGYTKANAEREKAARLSDLYNNPNQPDFDRRNIAVGNYTPIQSFYAQDQNNATTRRNADVSASSAANVANINNAGALARQNAQPVILSDGQTAVLPVQTAEATGLPGMFRGNVTTNPGQTVNTATGETIVGQPKPLTDSEMTAAIIAKQPEEAQRAFAMRGVGTTNVQDAKGEPVVAFTPDAVGKTPYIQDKGQTQVANYKTPAGAVGTARFDKDSNKWFDTQTGAELPAGVQTYSANLQGDQKSTGLGTTANNNIDSQLVDLALVDQTSKQLRNLVTNNKAVQGLAGSIRGTVQDVLQSGNEVGQLFKVNMKKMQDDIAAGRVDPAIAKQFTNFDPNIPAVNMLETLLTAQVAKVLDPDGRISNDRYKQVASALGQGGLTGNTARTIATLDQLDKITADRRGLLSGIRPDAARAVQGGVPTPAATPTPAPSSPAAPEVWERGPDGQLRRAQ
ncbi:hypothetical protein [Bradyrhizobium sp. 33ap4]|uniref:hypothetical protein n=1 Tax=Bradyrhizobium sp. 33ap4 TaxID=3061630 RepID=UPI00292D1E43|nr:hypothetical protein [Bradyrhizobium sp. 33ap4]